MKFQNLRKKIVLQVVLQRLHLFCKCHTGSYRNATFLGQIVVLGKRAIVRNTVHSTLYTIQQWRLQYYKSINAIKLVVMLLQNILVVYLDHN